MKIAAIADTHFQTHGNEELIPIFEDIKREAEVIVLAGDLTDSGRPEEMEALLQVVGRPPIPVVAILGNHDHEHDRAEDLIRMMRERGFQVIDGGSTFQVGDVGFAGIKGFGGGFAECLIQPFGERMIKQFVQMSIDEALRLGEGLAKLRTPHKVAVLHYAPAKGTLEGEPPEIYPFLGTSWLGDAIDNHGADFAVHGHAHQGSPEGRTKQNIPVYNVSRFVRLRTDSRPYLLIEV